MEAPTPAISKEPEKIQFKSEKITYEKLWKSIIRPERDIYTEEELGPEIFRFNNIIVHGK